MSKNIAAKIREKKADYILALKGSQGLLHDDVALYFKEQAHLTSCHFFEHNDKGHGRVERRRCYATNAIEWLEERHKWKDLETIVMVESIRYEKGYETLERRHLNSMALTSWRLNYLRSLDRLMISCDRAFNSAQREGT